jgi:succinyl-diaminopimelate desuccinylase
VGRDGASDAVAFLEVGVPAVEFGPRGAGHHGPEEYVEIESLPLYRRALADFARRAAAPPASVVDPEVATS